MKTQKYISNLRKNGIVVLASFALLNGTLKATESSVNAMISLESFVKAHEAVLIYHAPVINIEAEMAAESLNTFAESNETTLKYEASEYAEADARAEELAPALENLEMFTATYFAVLKYQAPAEDVTVEAVPAIEKLDMIAEARLSTLRYQAPVKAENKVYDATDFAVNDMLAETK